MADRLVIWDTSTGAVAVSTFFDWGEVLPSTMGEKRFIVRNESLQYTAKGVTVHTEDSVSSPSLSDQLLFSLDGWTFTDTLSLGDIPKSAISSEITLRRMTASNAVSGSYSLIVEAASWSV